MGNITKKIDAENDLTVFIVAGKVTADELIAAIHDFYESAVTSNVLWDLTSESSLLFFLKTSIGNSILLCALSKASFRLSNDSGF